MNFINEFGFDVKKGRAQDFQRWMSENESKLAAACPSGVEYVGTYAVMYSSEKHSGAIPSVLPLGELRLTGRVRGGNEGRRRVREPRRGDDRVR